MATGSMLGQKCREVLRDRSDTMYTYLEALKCMALEGLMGSFSTWQTSQGCEGTTATRTSQCKAYQVDNDILDCLYVDHDALGGFGSFQCECSPLPGSNLRPFSPLSKSFHAWLPSSSFPGFDSASDQILVVVSGTSFNSIDTSVFVCVLSRPRCRMMGRA